MMDITSAKYLNDDNKVIIIVADGQELFVPLDPVNRHYAEIMRQVAAGELTIADAD
tara:strand:- start:2049 stop:2216 length:168 start_codon:yes stop_codon:yes gene_type:complete